MITENDRNDLVEHRLNQASDTLELAKFLIANDKLIIAVNRIYYGMYNALTALALKKGFETSKHSQLIGWFNREFIMPEPQIQNTGKFYVMHFKTGQRGIMMLLSASLHRK